MKLLLTLITIWPICAYSQCEISQDSTGQIVTSCRTRSSVLRYLGSEFLTFPIWQEGAVLLGNTGRQFSGLICYNVYTNQVFCRLANDVVDEMFPDEFTINGACFVKQSMDGVGRRKTAYYLLHYRGTTKLLEHLSCSLEPIASPLAPFGEVSPYYARYRKKSLYYLQKGQSRLTAINFTKQSLLSALHDQSVALADFITKDKLSLHEVIRVLTYYDSLSTIAPR